MIRRRRLRLRIFSWKFSWVWRMFVFWTLGRVLVGHVGGGGWVLGDCREGGKGMLRGRGREQGCNVALVSPLSQRYGGCQQKVNICEGVGN